MNTKFVRVDKFFYEKYISGESFKDNFILGQEIPKIEMKEVKKLLKGRKVFYSLSHTSPHYHVQDRLIKNLLSKIPLNASAMAFRSGCNYLKYLEPHVSGTSFCRLDIISFFNSIKIEDFESALIPYVKDEFVFDGKQKIIDAIINSTSLEVDVKGEKKRFLPMGFKTSPVISNIIFRRLDIIIQSFCSKNGITYTRYADDMLFSMQSNSNMLLTDYFIREISSLVSIMGFRINEEKYIAKTKMISINGYVIENKGVAGSTGTIRLSNSKLALVRKILWSLDKGLSEKTICKKLLGINLKEKNFKYEAKKDKFEKKYYKDQLKNSLGGYRSYLIGFIKFNDDFRCIEKGFEKEIYDILPSIVKMINRL
jgi:hypothetical protein